MPKLTNKIGFCALCEKVQSNPCVPDGSFAFEGVTVTPELIPASVKRIRARPKSVYMTRAFACEIGRLFERLKLPEREVRGYVSYKIWEGLEQNIRYEFPWGQAMKFGPNTIDEVFDGRKTQYLSAGAEDWSDEIVSSDRVFGNLKNRAIAGHIRTVPDKRLHLRFMLIDLARRTPSAEVHGVD